MHTTGKGEIYRLNMRANEREKSVVTDSYQLGQLRKSAWGEDKQTTINNWIENEK